MKKFIIVIIASLVTLTGCSNKKVENEQINQETVSIQNEVFEESEEEKVLSYHDTEYVLDKLDKLVTREDKGSFYWYEDLCINVNPYENNKEKVDFISIISRDSKNPNDEAIDVVSELLEIEDSELIQRLKDIASYKTMDILERDNFKYKDMTINTSDTVSRYKVIRISLEN